MKLKEERNPWLISSSARLVTFSSPAGDSTSCVMTRANSLESGQPGQPAGISPAFGLIGHDARHCLMILLALPRLTASRMRRGMYGLNAK